MPSHVIPVLGWSAVIIIIFLSFLLFYSRYYICAYNFNAIFRETEYLTQSTEQQPLFKHSQYGQQYANHQGRSCGLYS